MVVAEADPRKYFGGKSANFGQSSAPAIAGGVVQA